MVCVCVCGGGVYVCVWCVCACRGGGGCEVIVWLGVEGTVLCVCAVAGGQPGKAARQVAGIRRGRVACPAPPTLCPTPPCHLTTTRPLAPARPADAAAAGAGVWAGRLPRSEAVLQIPPHHIRASRGCGATQAGAPASRVAWAWGWQGRREAVGGREGGEVPGRVMAAAPRRACLLLASVACSSGCAQCCHPAAAQQQPRPRLAAHCLRPWHCAAAAARRWCACRFRCRPKATPPP